MWLELSAGTVLSTARRDDNCSTLSVVAESSPTSAMGRIAVSGNTMRKELLPRSSHVPNAA